MRKIISTEDGDLEYFLRSKPNDHLMIIFSSVLMPIIGIVIL